MDIDVNHIKLEQILSNSVNILRNYMKHVIKSNVENFLKTSDESKLELEYDSKYGRYLVATRDISAGEVLFCEVPLVIAPQSGGDPTCLMCLRGFERSNQETCQECGGPMCHSCKSEGTKSALNLHTAEECEALKKLNVKCWDLKLTRIVNAVLTPLRTWFAIKNQPLVLPFVIAMQSNAKARKETAIGRFIDAVIVPQLNERLQIGIPEEFIHHVCGIFDTNAYKISNLDRAEGRALLPLTGLMAHDCCPNTDHWFTGSTNCVVRAVCDIRKGEKVTSSYVNTFLPTQIRRQHLLLTKLFSCQCDRCEDSSEFNTFLGYIQCRTCKTGLLAPPCNDGREWQCRNCKGNLSAEMVMMLNKAAGGIAGNSERRLESLPQLVRLVGRQHHSVLNLIMSEIRDKTQADVESFEDQYLQDLLAESSYLAAVADKLCPGLTFIKGEIALTVLKLSLETQRRGIGADSSSLSCLESPVGFRTRSLSEYTELCLMIYSQHPSEAEVKKLTNLMNS